VNKNKVHITLYYVDMDISIVTTTSFRSLSLTTHKRQKYSGKMIQKWFCFNFVMWIRV
jgi:hypothetical protein